MQIVKIDEKWLKKMNEKWGNFNVKIV